MNSALGQYLNHKGVFRCSDKYQPLDAPLSTRPSFFLAVYYMWGLPPITVLFSQPQASHLFGVWLHSLV